MNKTIFSLLLVLLVVLSISSAFAEKSKITGSYISIEQESKVSETMSGKKDTYYHDSTSTETKTTRDAEPKNYDYYFAKGENEVVETPVLYKTETEPVIGETEEVVAKEKTNLKLIYRVPFICKSEKNLWLFFGV